MEPALTDPTRGAIRVTTSTRRGATWDSSRRRSRPRRTVTLVHAPGRRDMSAHTFTPAHAVASTSRQALEWNALDLPLTRRWHLERLPYRLVAVPHVCDVREHAKG